MRRYFVRFKTLLSVSILVSITFFLSWVLMISGLVLVCFSLTPETLGDKYIISSVKEYTSGVPNKLKNGEIVITKDIIYNGNAEYKLVFNNYAKKIVDGELINVGSVLEVTEVFGEGYQIDKNKIIVNEKVCKLESDNAICNEGISVCYDNNIFKIKLSNSSLLKNNRIEVYIKLMERKTNYKYMTSKESYYSFTPSIENDFYVKKLSQSYVINGEGYIKLINKK